MRGNQTSIAIAVLVAVAVAIARSAAGQTFEVNQPSSSSSAAARAKKKAGPGERSPGESAIGWGSSIETAREARAVGEALARNDYRSAIASATRAAHSAPGNADMWFLVGYAARLGNDYALSLDGYRRGLLLKPSSIAGLSGEAQTYAKMGRVAQAEDLLKKVLERNPSSATDLELAGELALATKPEVALDLLKRSVALAP